MNCKECGTELIGADEGQLAEIGRYNGYCADCYDDLRSDDLECQLERSILNWPKQRQPNTRSHNRRHVRQKGREDE